jgi:hypothetical protein
MSRTDGRGRPVGRGHVSKPTNGRFRPPNGGRRPCRLRANQRPEPLRANSLALQHEKSVQHDFRKTDQIESVDGHDCRIWEEHDGNAKRYEFCVAPLGAVPGGKDTLRGMQTLSQYAQGAAFALGVQYRSQRWWQGFDMLGGVPISAIAHSCRSWPRCHYASRGPQI